MKYKLFILLISGFLINCGTVNPPLPKFLTGSEINIENLRLPEGFKIEVYASGVKNARSMEYLPNGDLVVGTRDEGKVYLLKDIDQDNRIDEILILAEKLKMPNGVAFKDGDLYVAEVNRIIKFADIQSISENFAPFEVVYDGLPSETHHGWKYIAFGPDGKLYIPVGAPCNVCEPEDEIYSTITRINPDGTDFEIVQRGIRNTVGFDWHPDTKELWFTDNGRDWMGDDQPFCELNLAVKDGLHFGFPYCHQGDLLDPDFGSKRPCSEFVGPAFRLGPHVAPLGMEFYRGDMFPEDFRNKIFIAEHGSWNRTEKSGYRVMVATLEGNRVTKYEPFIEGWLDKELDEVSGRPVDVEVLPDGSILVSDDYSDMIYRVTYNK
jgi:glucose/arabinose dehydrogenase